MTWFQTNFHLDGGIVQLIFLGWRQLPYLRRAFSENKAGEMSLFYNAWPEAYGFAVYVVQNFQSYLVFAKPKMAPLKKKTLTTLELLAVYLALKCLPTVLRGCSRFTPTKMQVIMDSQVVLSWIISGSIVRKNLFARNLMKDILQMVAELDSLIGLTPSFRYVLTTENPADLIARGLMLERFRTCLQFWCHGPDWIGLLHGPTGVTMSQLTQPMDSSFFIECCCYPGRGSFNGSACGEISFLCKALEGNCEGPLY